MKWFRLPHKHKVLASWQFIKITTREGIVREFGIDMYTLLYLKWINNKDLLYSTGNPAQLCNNLNGKRI